jgi:7-cyano-7-deazaguanine synthase
MNIESPMITNANGCIGVLLSGGLDSAILVGHWLAAGKQLQPFYIRTGLYWQAEELPAVERFLQAVASPLLLPLVVLDLPLADLYQGHWSLSGNHVPDAQSPDAAVFLPARNALLILKAAVWCQMRGIRQLALAPLGTSPFHDARAPFFEHFQAALNCGDLPEIELLRPFAGMTKRQVMELGRSLPLEHTFSCIAPQQRLHCGRCNKCAERQAAFAAIHLTDPTQYARR